MLAAHNMMQSASNRTQKEQAHEFLEKFQKSVRWAWTGLWQITWADGMGRSKKHGQQPWLCWSRALWMRQRSSSLPPPSRARCVGPQEHGRVSSLTQPDCIRPSPDTPRAAARAACLHHEEPNRLPCWAKAHQTDAVCVSGQLGDTDDRMERCPHRHCQRSGYRPSHTTLCPGFPPRPPRRSHAWTKDRTYSTSGRSTTHTQPAAPTHGPDM